MYRNRQIIVMLMLVLGLFIFLAGVMVGHVRTNATWTESADAFITSHNEAMSTLHNRLNAAITVLRKTYPTCTPYSRDQEGSFNYVKQIAGMPDLKWEVKEDRLILASWARHAGFNNLWVC